MHGINARELGRPRLGLFHRNESSQELCPPRLYLLGKHTAPACLDVCVVPGVSAALDFFFGVWQTRQARGGGVFFRPTTGRQARGSSCVYHHSPLCVRRSALRRLSFLQPPTRRAISGKASQLPLLHVLKRRSLAHRQRSKHGCTIVYTKTIRQHLSATPLT